MFGKPGPSRLLSPFSRQEPSGHPNDSSRTSASPTPGIKITASPTLIEGTICRDHDRSAQSLLGSLLEPPITSAATPSSIGSGARESKNGSSFRSSISARFWRSPSPGPNQGNKSSVSHLEQPIPATPLQSYPDESRPSSSLSTSDIKIDIPRATPGSNAASSNPANFRAQLKRPVI
ncbi:uncharacterized protein EI90DRAFT_3085191 [Cantharellus anzutake]|uniref:uncharacterized protein n=1 Tax=Cantharellus anzutake TaxID=1750568 RepID=UPI001906A18A|nr:uncharacterized protein EI90DRAFT_3085191 [Cantharellus anzutake]KAF8317508.1 hypothetical protein EI90DRAFT_3085191 [Cantharellus anzutake]